MAFNEYYKYYNEYRFNSIAEAKLNSIARTNNREFNLYLAFSLLIFLAFPCLQFIIPQINNENFNYNFKCYEYNPILFWRHSVLIFHIIAILSIVFSFIAFRLASSYRVDDLKKKSKLINRNNVLLTITFISNILLNSVCILINEIVLENGPTAWGVPPALSLLYFFVISSIYSTSIFVLMLLFFGARNFIKFDLNKVNEAIPKTNEKYSSIYWLYFIKYIFINDPTFWIGTILLILLTAIGFAVMGGSVTFFKHHFIFSVEFYSFYITAVTLIVSPILTGIRQLNSVYNNYTLHIIRNSILPNLKNHVVLMGIGSLGGQIVRNCFGHVHPESYGVNSLSADEIENLPHSVEELSDYNVIIDKELKLQIISQRIVVFDNDVSKFKELFRGYADISIGTFKPWLNQPICISLLGVCANEVNDQVLNTLGVERSDVIINATPNSKLSLLMASKFQKKQILSVNDSYTFDTLTSTTYDKAIFLIDTQAIEGILLSQLIFHWVNTNIRSNINMKYSWNYNIIMKKFEIEPSEEFSEKEFNYKLLNSGNGRVLIVGSGSYIYHIIKSLILTLGLSLGLDKNKIREVIQNKIYLLTDDEHIKQELINECGTTYWKFYPIRNNKTMTEDFYKITTFINSIDNFETYVSILSSSHNHFYALKPELIILNNSNPYTSIDMFVSASTAVEVINNGINEQSSSKIAYKPHIMVYSARNDEYYLIRHFKKYFTFDRERNEKIGFPTQLEKESRVTKDWLSALRYSAILRDLFTNDDKTVNRDHLNHHVAEITFSVREQNGSLANLAANLVNRELVYAHHNGQNVPRFLNYYSTAEIHYKDTFLFKGLAKLEKRVDIESIEEILNYCFINCEKHSRPIIYDIIQKNFEFEHTINSVAQIIDELKVRDLGMFSNYPTSTILRHPDKYLDISDRRPVFFMSEKPPETLEETMEKRTNQQVASSDFIKNAFNIADFTIWADGEETPGTLAEILAEVILCSTREKQSPSYTYNEDCVPLILHTANRPSPFFNNEPENKPHPMYTQDSFYIKLAPKSPKNQLHKGLARAIKVKLSGEILFENLDWSKYLFLLKEHLASKNSCNYYLYLIEKLFIEGLDTEGKAGITEISFYHKLESGDDLIKCQFSPQPHFKIIRSWEKLEQINKWKEVPKVTFFDNLTHYFKSNDAQIQRYEFAIIKEDIVEKSKHEELCGLSFGNEQNKLLYIDDI